jgi:hypothetical protein
MRKAAEEKEKEKQEALLTANGKGAETAAVSEKESAKDMRAVVREAVRDVLKEELSALVAQAVRAELAKVQPATTTTSSHGDMSARLAAVEEQSATAVRLAQNLQATLAALLNPALLAFPSEEEEEAHHRG